MIIDSIPFSIDVAKLFAQLHFDPAGECSPEVARLAAQAQGVARPKVLYEESFIDEKGGDDVRIGATRLTSRALRHNLEGIERVFPYVATCGHELDELPIDSSDFVGQFSRDVIKEMALAAAMAAFRERLVSAHGLSRMAFMHPGSGDANVWPIEQQRELFSLLGDTKALIGVGLTTTCLMLPNKTVSGIAFPTEVDFVTCQLCHRVVCPNRQAPFDEALWQARNPGPAAHP